MDPRDIAKNTEEEDKFVTKFSIASEVLLTFCQFCFLDKHCLHNMAACVCAVPYCNYWYLVLTFNFLVAVVNTLSTKTHSSKEIAEFCFENADVKSICYSKQRMKSKLSLSSECVKTKLCEPCISFTSHPHSWCGMVWYRT